MEIGVYTFVENTPDPATGRTLPATQRLRDLMEEIELADQVGLEVFGIGEHHRPDFLGSAPTIMLAAAAERTKTIRLSTAVTVLSSDDPVRVYEQFATLDLLSGGRAEIMAGRGSFIESFPLFGYDLDDYEQLFTTKLEQLLALRATGMANDRPVYPRPIQAPLPIWIAVGGTPQSVARAGYLGLPLALAIIGGQPERFAPMVELYRDAARQGGHDPETLPVSINSHAFVADTSRQAADTFYGPYSAVMTRIGRERGWSPMTRGQFDAALGLHNHLVVGDIDAVVEKILFQHSIFGHSRFLAQMSIGPMPHDAVLHSIELFGREVAPRVRAEIG